MDPQKYLPINEILKLTPKTRKAYVGTGENNKQVFVVTMDYSG